MTRTRMTLLALLVAVGALVFVATKPGRAEEPPYEMRYVSITGDGSNAKAWFEGAPPSGARVQETLDRFAREGYRFAALTPAWRQGTVNVSTVGPAPSTTTPPDATYVLLLEKNRAK